MQSVIDFVCSDCCETFETASSLLKHFALHVSLKHINTEIDKLNLKRKISPIPDLYPIKMKKNKNELDNSINKNDKEDNVDSGFEDVNPIKFCQVTMGDKKNETNEKDIAKRVIVTEECCKPKSFNCIYCLKSFGWSTNLKRHLLIHTGERPFKCEYCKLSFTRNFLLQKHKFKYHGHNETFFNVTKMKIPSLKPLNVSVKHKPRKQEKCNIKRKMCSTKAVYQSNVKNLIYNKCVNDNFQKRGCHTGIDNL